MSLASTPRSWTVTILLLIAIVLPTQFALGILIAKLELPWWAGGLAVGAIVGSEAAVLLRHRHPRGQ